MDVQNAILLTTFTASPPSTLRNAYHGMSPYTMGLTAHSTWKFPVPTGLPFTLFSSLYLFLFLILILVLFSVNWPTALGQFSLREAIF